MSSRSSLASAPHALPSPRAPRGSSGPESRPASSGNRAARMKRTAAPAGSRPRSGGVVGRGRRAFDPADVILDGPKIARAQGLEPDAEAGTHAALRRRSDAVPDLARGDQRALQTLKLESNPHPVSERDRFGTLDEHAADRKVAALALDDPSGDFDLDRNAHERPLVRALLETGQEL